MRFHWTRSVTLFAITAGLTTILAAGQVPALAQRGQSATHPGQARKKPATYAHRQEEGQPGRGRKAVRQPQDPAVVEVFKDFNAWWGDDRDGAALAAMGKIPGVDHFIHPVSELADGISPSADVVLITSNSWGHPSTRTAQTEPAAQANLATFASLGGVVIVDMGDNDYSGGFMAPGSIGTPDWVLPASEGGASLTSAAVGEDGVLGTGDDHRLVRGPDGVPGTGDDLDNANIDGISGLCCIAIGNLREGVVLPPSATILMTAPFAGLEKPILAEYCLGYGRVIVDTVTKEWGGQDPAGQGASRFLLALLSYALDARERIDCQINGLMESVRWMEGDKAVPGLERKLSAARADVSRGQLSAACGKLRAFANAARAQRGKALPGRLVDEWIAVATKARTALGC